VPQPRSRGATGGVELPDLGRRHNEMAAEALLLTLLSLGSRFAIRALFAAAPPGDALLARCIRKPQEQIAMAGERGAEAHKITAAQFIERTQQFMLIAQPALVPGDDGCTITIGADPERIAPFASAADVNGTGWHTRFMLVENPAHVSNLLISVRAERS